MDGTVESTLLDNDALAFSEACIDAAGLRDRVQTALDPKAGVLRISGPDGFGFLGMTAWQVVKVPLPTTRLAVGTAVARHVVAEFWATDAEIQARAQELPMALAMVLTAAR